MELKNVDPNIKKITFQFSEKLNGYNTGVDYSELGEIAFPKVTTEVGLRLKVLVS